MNNGSENPKTKKLRSSSVKPDQVAAEQHSPTPVQDCPSNMVTPGSEEQNLVQTERGEEQEPRTEKTVISEQYTDTNTSRTKPELLTNIRRIENRVMEGETITNFEIIDRDWDQHLKEHKERLEAEITLRENKIKKSEIKEKSWQLYKESKKFLEENEKEWEKRRIEREIETKKIERIAVAKAKQENLRNKIKERKLADEIKTSMSKLPQTEKKET